MKQIFFKNIKTLLCLALVLCTVLLPLVSCKALKDFAESKPKDPETTTDVQTDDPAPVVKYQRKNMKYTFLGVTEGNEAGTLGSLTYSVFDTAQLTVNEIAEKTGFSDYNYFLKVFKRHFGTSPKKMMKR